MSESLPLDGVKVFLHIREGRAHDTPPASTAAAGSYQVVGPQRATGSADAVRRRTRKLVKQLGGTLCLSERAADMVLCYHATPSFLRELLHAPESSVVVVDPAYAEACVEANRRLDAAPFTFVWRPSDGEASQPQPQPQPVTSSPSAFVATEVATPPLRRSASPRRGPVTHVNQLAFAFDSEVSPISHTTMPGDGEHHETHEAATPPLTVAPVTTMPTRAIELFPSGTLDGAASASTTTLTQNSLSTPPYAPLAPLSVSMEEVRHAGLRAAVRATVARRHAAHDEACRRPDTETAETSSARTRRRRRADPFLVASTDDLLFGHETGTTAGRGQQAEDAIGGSSSLTLRSRTPTPRVTQRLSSSTPPGVPPPADSTPPLDSPLVSSTSAGLDAIVTAPQTAIVPDVASSATKKKNHKSARTTAKLAVKVHSAQLRPARRERVSSAEPPSVSAPAPPVELLPPGLRPLPLYDATGHPHPRAMLCIGVIPDAAAGPGDSTGTAGLSLWADVVEQLGARFVALPPHLSTTSTSTKPTAASVPQRRRRRPNVLVAPADCELTVEVLYAKAQGIRILLPQWLEDAILLGDFPDVLPDRHVHPLFGREEEENVAGADAAVASAAAEEAAEAQLGAGLADEFRDGVPPTDLLGVSTPNPPAGGPALTPSVDDAHTTHAPRPVARRTRGPRTSREVQFLQRTTADEFLPVGQQWERPYFRPIFRNMMFYLRSADEIDKGGVGAMHVAVVTLEHVAHVIRTLGGTVTRNLESAHLDVVLDLVVDFGQLAAEVGVQAAAAAAVAAAPDATSSTSTSSAPAGGGTMAACPSLSLVYQHTLTCMETYSQLHTALGAVAPCVQKLPCTDSMCTPTRMRRTEAAAEPVGAETEVGGQAAEASPPPLAVVGLPWLIYSVLTRRCADLGAFASARAPPLRKSSSSASASSATALARRRARERSCATRTAESEDGDATEASAQQSRTPAPVRDEATRSASPVACPAAISPLHLHERRPSHGSVSPTRAVDAFLRGFVSPMAKTRASGSGPSPGW